MKPVLISFLSPIADDGISYAYGYVFVGCNLAAAALVWFFLYESRTLSLENVDRMYGEKDVKPWTSSRWTPPGYITRKQRDGSHDHDDDDATTRIGSTDTRPRGASHEKKHSGDSVPSETRREDVSRAV